MLDGEHMAGRSVIVALAITADGRKFSVGLRNGATENKTVVRSVLADLFSRGLSADDGLLVVIDGDDGPVGRGAVRLGDPGVPAGRDPGQHSLEHDLAEQVVGVADRAAGGDDPPTEDWR